MEYQAMFNFVGGILLVAIGWWCKEIWDSVKTLKADIKAIEIDLPKNYVSKTDIESRFDKIDATLERLFDRLDAKADKWSIRLFQQKTLGLALKQKRYWFVVSLGKMRTKCLEQMSFLTKMDAFADGQW